MQRKDSINLILIVFIILFVSILFSANALESDYESKAKISESYSQLLDNEIWLNIGIETLKRFTEEFQQSLINPLSQLNRYSNALLAAKEAVTLSSTLNSLNLATALGEMRSFGVSYCGEWDFTINEEGSRTSIYNPSMAFEYLQTKYSSGEEPNIEVLKATKNLLLCYNTNVEKTSANSLNKQFIKSITTSAIEFIDAELNPETQEDEEPPLESMIETIVRYYNDNFNSIKGDSILSSLISRFGNEKVLVTITPTGKIVSIVLKDGKITDYRIGEEIEGITVDAEIDEESFKEIYYSENPTATFSTAWKKGEIEVEPRTLKLKVVNTIANIYKGILRLFGR